MPLDPTAVGRAIAHGAGDAEAAAQASSQHSATDVWTHASAGYGHQGSADLLDLPQSGSSSTPLCDIPGALRMQAGDLSGAVAEIGKANGALATTGAVFGALTAAEQMVSTVVSAIPFPAFPAVRVADFDVGLPHAHSHPPNLVPPAPPIPLPSTGPVIPIPYVSGAATVLINGMPAGRCGDIGMGIWCGGYFPMFEIFLGSSSVWIEGMRAARIGVDITKHCTFSTPKPSDPPLGPMIGMTVSASPNVIIGGVPMPSLTAMALGAAMKAAFKGLGRLARLLMPAGEAGERAISRSTAAFSRNARFKFSELPGGAKRLVRELAAHGEAGAGAGVRVTDLRLASEFLNKEVAVVQHSVSGELRVVLGSEVGCKCRAEEEFLVHTHPVYATEEGHLAKDIRNGTDATEAVVDWGGNVTHFDKNGIIPNPAASPINDHGYIVGHPR